jgi:hypothetical protein
MDLPQFTTAKSVKTQFHHGLWYFQLYLVGFLGFKDQLNQSGARKLYYHVLAIVSISNGVVINK